MIRKAKIETPGYSRTASGLSIDRMREKVNTTIAKKIRKYLRSVKTPFSIETRKLISLKIFKKKINFKNESRMINVCRNLFIVTEHGISIQCPKIRCSPNVKACERST